MNRIQNHFKQNTSQVSLTVESSLREYMMMLETDKPDLLKLIWPNAHALTSSFFMPFVLFFDEETQKLIHWPVAGPVGFNCRIIKHEILEKLNKCLKREGTVGSGEPAFIVPFKGDDSPAGSNIQASSMCSIFF